MLKSVQLGNSGLRVSELCLGTMNFGNQGAAIRGTGPSRRRGYLYF